jgi:hypothetical protein
MCGNCSLRMLSTRTKGVSMALWKIRLFFIYSTGRVCCVWIVLYSAVIRFVYNKKVIVLKKNLDGLLQSLHYKKYKKIKQ